MEPKYLYSVRKGYPLRLCVFRAEVIKETTAKYYLDGSEAAGYHRSARKCSSAEMLRIGDEHPLYQNMVAEAGGDIFRVIFYASARDAIVAARDDRRTRIEALQAEITELDKLEQWLTPAE